MARTIVAKTPIAATMTQKTPYDLVAGVLDRVDGTVDAIRDELEAAGGVGLGDCLEVRPGQRAEHLAMSSDRSPQLCGQVSQLDQAGQCEVARCSTKQVLVDRVDMVLRRRR